MNCKICGTTLTKENTYVSIIYLLCKNCGEDKKFSPIISKTMDKLKSKWVEVWSVEDIIGNAVSLGMEFMAKIESPPEVLQHNKNILIKELNFRNYLK